MIFLPGMAVQISKFVNFLKFKLNFHSDAHFQDGGGVGPPPPPILSVSQLISNLTEVYNVFAETHACTHLLGNFNDHSPLDFQTKPKQKTNFYVQVKTTDAWT